MGKVFSMISGKGGTGKSTVAVGLASSLSALGKRVLLIDLDAGLRCLDTLLGIDENIVFDLGDLISSEVELQDVLYDAPLFGSVQLIAAPQKKTDIPAEKLCELVSEVSQQYDAVILDLPAGIDEPLLHSMSKQATFISVCNPDPISVKDAAAVCNVLDENRACVRLVVNRFTADMLRKNYKVSIDDIIDLSGARLIGIVPFSKELSLLSVNPKNIKRGRSKAAFIRISKRLFGEDVLLPNIKKI